MDYSGNRSAIWNKAFSPDKIPEYPTYSLAVAKGGETTYEIDRDNSIILANPFNSAILIRPRAAEPGELLRDSVLKYIADWSENCVFRGEIVSRAQDDPKCQELQRILCKSSILYFVNTFCWTFDDRFIEESGTVPFVTYPFQDDILTWTIWLIVSGLAGVEEKSRDMGASWLEVAVAVWLALFHSRMNTKFMSMRQEDVDDRTTDSLLGKVRFLLNHLPEWMRGGWVERGERMDVSMSIIIPETGSNIKGILSRGTAGRSGRTAYLAADEWAFVEESAEVLRALSELSNCKKYLSSANGAGNEMYRMREDPASHLKTLHHTLHPLKNPEWAQARKGRSDVTEETWAAEQEISYELSTIGRVFPQFRSIPSDEHAWCHVQDSDLTTYEPAYDVFSFTDLGVGDPCSTLFAQIKPVPPDHAAFEKVCLAFFDEHEARDMTALDLRYLLNQKEYRYRDHICDWRTGNQRDAMGFTWIKYLADLEVKPTNSAFFGMVIEPGPPIKMHGQRSDEKSTLIMMREKFNAVGAIAVSKSGCPGLTKALQNWSFPIDKNTHKPVTDSGPKHDGWSHACKAALYGIDWIYGKKRGEKTDRGPWDYPAVKLNIR